MIQENVMLASDSAESLARNLYPSDVALAVSFPWDKAEGLYPAERASLAKPNEKRLAEFASGRRAAHQAMSELGFSKAAVLHGLDRAPVWPKGVTGSISHCDSICMAVLGHSDRYAALALDIEEDLDLPEDVFPVVCTQMELAWLSVQPEDIRGRLARLIFSAKESAYKLQYTMTGEILDFSAFEVTPDLETGQFEATLTRDVAQFPARSQFAGRFAFGAGLVMTGMTILAQNAP